MASFIMKQRPVQLLWLAYLRRRCTTNPIPASPSKKASKTVLEAWHRIQSIVQAHDLKTA